MLLSAILSFAAFADYETVTVGGMTFQKNWEGDACALINIDENVSGDIVIPNTVKFGTDILPVDTIWCDGCFEENNAFYKNKNIMLTLILISKCQ